MTCPHDDAVDFRTEPASVEIGKCPRCGEDTEWQFHATPARLPCLMPDFDGDDCRFWAKTYGQEPCANCAKRYDLAATPAPLDDDGWQERGNPGDDAAPAPLDAALCDCGDGYPSYGIGKRKHLPSCHYGIIADWLDQPAPTPLAPHPGENHEYDMTCRRCGEPGYLFVGFHSPGETFRWSEAQPKEAE